MNARMTWPHEATAILSGWSFSSCCAGMASATRRCCAPWTKCRASISLAPTSCQLAYADQALPIACGQTISQPYVVAYMTEQLEVEPKHRVLEVGTGSGYQAAVLSRIAREVISIERYRTLAEAARDTIETLGYTISPLSSATALPASRIWRRTTVSSSPPLPKRSRRRWSLSSPRTAKWCCRSAPRTDRNSSSKCQSGRAAKWMRENLIAVRFVPLLPGQAREL